MIPHRKVEDLAGYNIVYRTLRSVKRKHRRGDRNYSPTTGVDVAAFH